MIARPRGSANRDLRLTGRCVARGNKAVSMEANLGIKGKAPIERPCYHALPKRAETPKVTKTQTLSQPTPAPRLAETSRASVPSAQSSGLTWWRAGQRRIPRVMRHRRRAGTSRHSASLLQVYCSPRQTTTSQPKSVSRYFVKGADRDTAAVRVSGRRAGPATRVAVERVTRRASSGAGNAKGQASAAPGAALAARRAAGRRAVGRSWWVRRVRSRAAPHFPPPPGCRGSGREEARGGARRAASPWRR
jgi:hypothetical protein